MAPGHLAAIESATLPASTVPEPKPNHTHKTESNSGSHLTVGPDVKLKGAEILDCDTLIVEGRVEATMDSRVIQIAANGSFSGKVGIDVAEIFGQFEGDLTARHQLIIHGSGRVNGKIRYGKILIEEGGELSGDIASISAEPVSSFKSGELNRKSELQQKN
jgi:cytoskeletal protein CcmA (bactofilin family)